MTASNGKWVNPVPSQVEHGTGLALAALSSYLGGWQNDSGRYPMVNPEQAGFGGARGNAAVVSFYKITGDQCQWVGHYQKGSTTVWAATALQLFTPVVVHRSEFEATFASAPLFGVRAFNGSFYGGFMELTNGTGVLYGTDGAPATPWTNAAPFAWGTGSILSWNVTFRIQA